MMRSIVERGEYKDTAELVVKKLGTTVLYVMQEEELERHCTAMKTLVGPIKRLAGKDKLKDVSFSIRVFWMCIEKM